MIARMSGTSLPINGNGSYGINRIVRGFDSRTIRPLCDSFEAETVRSGGKSLAKGGDAGPLKAEKFHLSAPGGARYRTLQEAMFMTDVNAVAAARFRHGLDRRNVGPSGHFIQGNHVIVVHD